MLFAKLVVKEFVVEGIHCSKCKARVEEALKSIEGVKKASADVATGKTVIKSKLEVSNEVIKEKLEDLGFTPVFE